MNILFLTYDVPWPLDAGGKVRAYNLIKILSKRHRVTLFTFFRREEQLQHLKHLTDICHKIIPVKRNTLYDIHTWAFSLAKPFPAALYYHPAVARLLLDTMTIHRYDAVHFESFYTSPYIDLIRNIPTIMGTENIEWRVYDEFVNARVPSFLHIPASWEIARLRSFEKYTWKTAHVCLAVSRQNADEIKEVVHQYVPVIANGIDIDTFAYKHNPSTNTILFVGNYSYIQNTDSVQWIVEHVVPHISSTATFCIAGKNPTADIKKLNGQVVRHVTVRVAANVPDIRDVYASSAILLAPIRVGSGTQFKMLEAMACGVPVVTNTKGIEGIPAVHEKEVLISDTEEDMAYSVDTLLGSREQRMNIALSARAMIERRFTWDAIGKELERVYSEV